MKYKIKVIIDNRKGGYCSYFFKRNIETCYQVYTDGNTCEAGIVRKYPELKGLQCYWDGLPKYIRQNLIDERNG